MTESIRWVDDMLPRFLRFCGRLRIATKELGVIRLDTMMSSQRYCVDQLFQGLDEGIHDFLWLKSRQLGISTILWALDLWWLQRFPGMQGIYITDDADNTRVHRRIVMDMYATLPPAFTRGRPKIDNDLLLEWMDQGRWDASRLIWAHGQASITGQLGRSLGLNFLHAEELDGWRDDPQSLVLATEHQHRLYNWVGTGQGFGLLYQMWTQAEHTLTRRRIFIGWMHLDTHRLDPDSPDPAKRALWNAYGAPKPTSDERDWIKEAQRTTGMEVTQEQLAWWRKEMAEAPAIKGNLAKMMQEHPWFPDQAFQAAGSRFISPTTMIALHQAQRRAPEVKTYRYDWGATFDERGDEVLVETSEALATLTVWEEPEPAGLYVVAGDPAYGSSDKADSFAATVWRCWPDRLVQVAEFHTPAFAMYQFAWVLAHLSGVYPRWLIYEVTGPGYAVMQELKRMREFGFGLSKRGGSLQQVIAGIQEYLYMRPDTFTSRPALEWKSSQERREWVMTELQDVCERGMLHVRSQKLWGEIGALRREGARIEAGGVAHDDLAITAALATEYWLQSIIEEGLAHLPPANAKPTAQTDPTQRAVRGFLARINKQDERPARKLYGVRASAPGR